MTHLKKSHSIINVGVDVGKAVLDVCIHEKQLHWQDENSPEGTKRILKRLSHYQVERLVIEATGRYEFELAQSTYDKGLPVCIVKPLRIRRYAQSMELLAVTDKLDAYLIAESAATAQPEITPGKSKNLLAIRDLAARRRQLMTMRTQKMNRTGIMSKIVVYRFLRSSS